MHFDCFVLSQYLIKLRRLKNKIRLRTIETQNLILFLISGYWNRENNTPQNTILPKSRNYVPAKLRTNKVVGPGISPPISLFDSLTTTQQRCRQRLHFHCVRKRAKSSPCWQPFNFLSVHAWNSSHDSEVKLIVRFVIKWCEYCGNKKIGTTLICYGRLMQSSKLVKNRKKPIFKIYSSRFLDRFERLLAEATFRMPAHTAKM